MRISFTPPLKYKFPMNRKKILYAEDESELNELITEFLTGEGYDLISVKNGLEAQEILRNVTVDLLLADFNMPKLDGAHLLIWCRQNNLHFPVVFMTGAPERFPQEEKALGDCCSTIIHKPCNLSLLVEAIEFSFDKHHDFDCRGEISSVESDQHFVGQHIIHGTDARCSSRFTHFEMLPLSKNG